MDTMIFIYGTGIMFMLCVISLRLQKITFKADEIKLIFEEIRDLLKKERKEK